MSTSLNNPSAIGWKNVGLTVHKMIREENKCFDNFILDETDFKKVHMTVSKDYCYSTKPSVFNKKKYNILTLSGSDDHGVNRSCMRILDLLQNGKPVVLNVIHTNQILLALQIKRKLTNPLSNLKISKNQITTYHGKDDQLFLQMCIIFEYEKSS
jgi:hypothetical protein